MTELWADVGIDSKLMGDDGVSTTGSCISTTTKAQTSKLRRRLDGTPNGSCTKLSTKRSRGGGAISQCWRKVDFGDLYICAESKLQYLANEWSVWAETSQAVRANRLLQVCKSARGTVQWLWRYEAMLWGSESKWMGSVARVAQTEREPEKEI